MVWSVCLFVGQEGVLSCTKTDEPIEMPFRRQTLGTRNFLIEGVWVLNRKGQFCGGFSWNHIQMSAKVDAVAKVGVLQRCSRFTNYFDHLLLSGGSVAEWLVCWTQAQKGLGSGRSRDAVG